MKPILGDIKKLELGENRNILKVKIRHLKEESGELEIAKGVMEIVVHKIEEISGNRVYLYAREGRQREEKVNAGLYKKFSEVFMFKSIDQPNIYYIVKREVRVLRRKENSTLTIGIVDNVDLAYISNTGVAKEDYVEGIKQHVFSGREFVFTDENITGDFVLSGYEEWSEKEEEIANLAKVI